jgi:2-polyprenyl-6-hydroxyphenyl methylase/3-demethylubiquinone-9 3-methyltransferase
MNYDSAEIAKFAALASQWWDTTGELRTLHQINPLRLCYIKEKLNLPGLAIVDIGCGGGILAESLALEGAHVTGIDLNEKVLEVARLHLLESGAQVHYQCTPVEALAAEHPEKYDVVTCLEMLEHVPDPGSVVKACAQLVKPGGYVFFSTINRNPKAYLFAILGAEYLLKLLPKNTHNYAKFIRPSELCRWGRQNGLEPIDSKGIAYHVLTKKFTLTDNVEVNYLLTFQKTR